MEGGRSSRCLVEASEVTGVVSFKWALGHNSFSSSLPLVTMRGAISPWCSISPQHQGKATNQPWTETKNQNQAFLLKRCFISAVCYSHERWPKYVPTNYFPHTRYQEVGALLAVLSTLLTALTSSLVAFSPRSTLTSITLSNEFLLILQP